MSQAPQPVLVVGVDGSAQARGVIALAQRLGKAMHARRLFAYVHPYGPLQSMLSSGDYERLIAEVVDQTVGDIQAITGEQARSHMRLVDNESPAAGLQALAESEGAVLIVVGSSRRSGSGRIRPGSVAERLLSGSPVAIAVAPGSSRSTTGDITRVACAFDGSAQSWDALAWAHRLAQPTGSSLSVISVFRPVAFGVVAVGVRFGGETVNQALRAQLRRTHDDALSKLGGEDVVGTFLEGDPAELLVSESRSNDVLVMGSRGYGPLRAVLLGSTSNHVIRNAHCPVVVLPRGSETPPTSTAPQA